MAAFDHESIIASVSQVLNTLHAHHAHAKNADIEKYFACFAADGQSLGTASDESWSIPEYRDYMNPFFTAGQRAAAFVPKPNSRKFTCYPPQNPNCVTFDEILECQGMNIEARGTGCLVLDTESGKWLVMLYHLNLPIPNDITDSVCKILRKGSK